MQNDYFKNKSNNYEKDKNRVNNVQNIANCILKEIEFNKTMHIMDFGSGTGLLLEKIAPYVKKISAVDLSESMNKKLSEKKEFLDCELEIHQIDINKSNFTNKFDCIISSMTLHHIENITLLFEKFYNLLNTNSTIALADLYTEDGSFHTEDTGVYHFGFSEDEMINIAKKTGFKNIKIQKASIASKPHGNYPIFLLTASK